MSDIIQLLPDSVANQIAAGEVIQRPASVIKELVENAVDAGAKTIRVLVVDAGRTSIQVIDDGCGMSETDARLAFERHATSKIRQADDLFALRTMGFRGEALPSIAAVSVVELTTRMASEDIGTHLTLQGSRVANQEPVACPVGCNFKVENLFFNVPARRKFLKTNATELNNILMAFERIVLVYPNINFVLYSNGQELMNLRAGHQRQRIADVFGKKTSQELLPVEVETSICRITGFVGKPEAARKKAGYEYFFVNGRYMKHAYFHKAVCSAFERLVPVGMQVPYFLYFEVDPADIDVNIHPTKTEIKFENEQSIWQILQAAVKDAIGKFCDVPTIDFDTEGKPEIPVFDPQRDAVELPRVNYNPDYNPFEKHSSETSVSYRESSYIRRGDNHIPTDWQKLYESQMMPLSSESNLFPLDEPTEEKDKLISEKSPVHYQFKGCYIMTAVKSGLMIIDQHRADIRIRYERYLELFRQKVTNTQRILFPEVMEFPMSDSVMVDKFMPDLTAMGFDISSLGGGSYVINGIPAGLEGLSPEQLIRQVVADAKDKGSGNAEEIHAALALSLARHAAIPQGQVLTNEEMEHIVNELFSCSNVNYTPDGHSILYILPQHDIEQTLG
jgi:DNA mismatch repair protein MutL